MLFICYLYATYNVHIIIERVNPGAALRRYIATDVYFSETGQASSIYSNAGFLISISTLSQTGPTQTSTTPPVVYH